MGGNENGLLWALAGFCEEFRESGGLRIGPGGNKLQEEVSAPYARPQFPDLVEIGELHLCPRIPVSSIIPATNPNQGPWAHVMDPLVQPMKAGNLQGAHCSVDVCPGGFVVVVVPEDEVDGAPKATGQLLERLSEDVPAGDVPGDEESLGSRVLPGQVLSEDFAPISKAEEVQMGVCEPE